MLKSGNDKFRTLQAKLIARKIKIKSTVDLSINVAESPNLVSNFLIRISPEDLERENVVTHNKAVLDALLDIDLITEFSNKFLKNKLNCIIHYYYDVLLYITIQYT